MRVSIITRLLIRCARCVPANRSTALAGVATATGRYNCMTVCQPAPSGMSVERGPHRWRVDCRYPYVSMAGC